MVWMHGKSFYTRVFTSADDTVGTKVRLGTNDAKYAAAIEHTLDVLRRKGTYFDILAAVADGRLNAGVLDEAYRGDRHLTSLRAEQAVVDLEPLVARWGGRGARGAKSEKYVTQVRALIPEGVPFPLANFTHGNIARFLDALDVGDSTKTRYKAALTQFGRWLVGQGVLTQNPLREVPGYAKSDPRIRWMTPNEAVRVHGALTGEAALVSGLMALTGIEWGALKVARRSDVDLKAMTLRARGTKHTPGRRNWRDRTVEILAERQWHMIWCSVELALKVMTPNAPLVTISEGTALRHLAGVLKALKLPHHTLHDWRHTYAVNAIKRGDDEQAIKRQLGHAPNSTLLHTTYGVYLDEAKAAHERAVRHRRVP